MKTFRVFGLKVEKYYMTTCEGGNCSFEYGKTIADKNILLLIDDEDNTCYTLSLELEEGECGSGWCTAQWAYASLEKVDSFGSYHYRPKQRLTLSISNSDFISKDVDEIETCFLEFSYDGGDGYYPSGGYSIDMSYFIPTGRQKDKMPVWIFVGESATGKSFIASKLDDSIKKYETDSSHYLPESLNEYDVIVLGNRSNISIEDVIYKITDDKELHIVNFN